MGPPPFVSPEPIIVFVLAAYHSWTIATTARCAVDRFIMTP
jgi:hypothetical protein